MRKETHKIVTAFLRHESATAARTYTTGEAIYLHENEIAFWNYGEVKPKICFTLAGWNTVTTRERINGLLELSGSNWRVCQRDFLPYLINVKTDKIVALCDTSRYFAPESDEDLPEKMPKIMRFSPYAGYELRH